VGFVDELGTFEDAVKRAAKLAKISRANVVKYHRTMTWATCSGCLGNPSVRR